MNFGAATLCVCNVEVNLAYRASLRSACLSRQVGAAVLDKAGFVVATGCNDVPMYGGGLYNSEAENDERCWARGGKCYNDDEKAIIAKSLLDDLTKLCSRNSKDSLTDDQMKLIKEAIRGSRIRTLIEFSRAVHAEMDAIVSVARSGQNGLQGATLYCTTYPCHNCAKHIIAAGIHCVVYLEPYEKSLASKLHSDAVTHTLDEINKLLLRLYEGVSPRRYDSLFTAVNKRKNDGVFIDLDRKRLELLPRGFQRLDTLEQRLRDVEPSDLSK